MTTLSHLSGSLSADGSGFGTRGLGTLTADLHQVRNQTYFYTENSSRWLESAQRQSSLARTDALTYQLLSSPQTALSYTSRLDLAPADAGEVFGFEQPSNPPSGSTSSTSFVARAGGALTSHSRLNATGYRNMVTGINTAYDGKRDINFGSSGVDNSDTQGSRFTAEQSLEYDYQSPERLANNRLTYSSTGEGGDMTLVVPTTMLLLEDLPTTNDDDDILSGGILSRGELPVSKLKTKSTLSVDSRGAYATQRGGATPGEATSLLAGAAGYLGGHTPAALVASGSTAAPLRPHAAPAGGDDRQLNFYWTAWKNESESDTTLDQIARFNSQATFTPGGGTSVSRDGRRDDRTVFSGKSSYSSDALSYWGHAPKVTRTENWTAAQGAEADPFALADADQTGSGAFAWAHRGLQNHYAGRGNDGLQYDLTLDYLPDSDQSGPESSFTAHSGTALRTPDGELTLSGTHGYSSTTTLDTDQSGEQEKYFSAAFEQTGQASGDHRFLKALDLYDYARTRLGWGSWSSVGDSELVRGRSDQQSAGDGSWSQTGDGIGYALQIYDLDERTAGSAGGSGSSSGGTLGGLLAQAGGLDRSLKYRYRELVPLLSQEQDDSSWSSAFQQATQDLNLDEDQGSGDGEEDSPADGPQYVVTIGDEARTSHSGSGSAEQSSGRTWSLAGLHSEESWELEALGGSGLEGSPLEVRSRGLLKSVTGTAPRTITVSDNLTERQSYRPDGLHLTASGQQTISDKLDYEWTNPQELVEEQVAALAGGGKETTRKTVEAEKYRLKVSDLTRSVQELEDFGQVISWAYTQPEEDEQILVAPWGVLEFDARLTGKLTDVMTSVGAGAVDGKLTRRVERSLPLPGSSSSGTQGDTHGGFSEHTDRWQLRPSWNTSDTLVVEADAAGAVERKLTIGGTFGETLWLGTEGRHVYDEWLYDSYVQGTAREMRTGEYDSSGFVWTDTARSGTVTSQFDPEGELLSASGALRQQIESGGLASSEDQEYATRTSGDWEAIRSYERSSSDNFRSSLTRDWTPQVTASGELDYEATDAAFTQQFWGEYEESDTRSVWDGHQWRLQETERTRGGAYGAGVSNPLVQTKAGGAALDLGFYNGGHHSWGYEGKAVHALFSPAILGPGPNPDSAFWDDSANPENPGGPLGPPLAEDPDLAGQTAALGLGVPNWVHWKYGAGAGGSLETYKGLGSDVIRMLANQQADTIMAANGNLGIFVTIDGQRKLVEYEWIPPVENYRYGLLSPGRYEFKGVYSGYSTGVIGQDPGAQADSLYFSSNLMLYGGLGGIAVSAPGAVAASAASGLTGVLTWGAVEVTSAATGLPIPTPGGAARSTAKNLAGTAAEQLAKSADELQDVADGVADALRNAPSSAAANPVAYGTPFRQLSAKKIAALEAKVADRTITKAEWKHLELQRRLTDRRQAGIDAFWAQERQALSQGLAVSRNWNDAARQSILSGGQPRGIFSHHKYSVSQYPQLANDPNNILPVTFFEHFQKWHGENWRNATHGVPLRPDLPDSF